jgi:hypothetical protein
MLDVLADYMNVPARVRRSIRGLSEDDLDLRGGSEGWSIRETVHHLVEANLIASNMIIAAIAADGYAFDWTWVNPDKGWMRRAGYDKAGVAPALAMLRALCAHIAGLITSRALLARKINVNDSPGAPRYAMTIDDILREQVKHLDGHLADIKSTREKRGR